jgi:hypothetical protein
MATLLFNLTARCITFVVFFVLECIAILLLKHYVRSSSFRSRVDPWIPRCCRQQDHLVQVRDANVALPSQTEHKHEESDTE